MHRAPPRLGVLRRLRPAPGHSADDEPSPPAPPDARQPGRPGMASVFTAIRSPAGGAGQGCGAHHRSAGPLVRRLSLLCSVRSMRRPYLWEPDPITDEQVRVLFTLLGSPVLDEELEGFLIVCSRLVDEFGGHRTHELADIFRTSATSEGRDVLRQSLRYMNRWVGGLAGYESRFPVTIIPARPAFPLFKIIGIDRIAQTLFRVLDSHTTVGNPGEPVKQFIARTGRLPGVPRQVRPVRRSKPWFHWCSDSARESPSATREALQILPEWSDCSLRASIPAASVSRSTFLCFNGDRPILLTSDEDPDPNKKRKKPRRLKFVKYFYEPVAQDHEPLSGGGLQIGVAGAPRVSVLEEWSERQHKWNIVWRA
jgi:hypothetical protein